MVLPTRIAKLLWDGDLACAQHTLDRLARVCFELMQLVDESWLADVELVARHAAREPDTAVLAWARLARDLRRGGRPRCLDAPPLPGRRPGRGWTQTTPPPELRPRDAE
jgi:hypothetical protein